MQTASASVTEEFLTDDVEFQEISMLPIDHPGAHDPEYRARRAAKLHRAAGETVPRRPAAHHPRR